MQSWMIGVVSGVLSVGFWPILPGWKGVLLLALIASTALRCRSHVGRCFAGIGCGCLLGVAHGDALLTNRLSKACVGEPLHVIGHIASLPKKRRMYGSEIRREFLLTVDELLPLHCAGPQKIQLSYYGDALVTPGEVWLFDVKLKRPWGLANPGVFNMQAWFAQNAIDAVGSIRVSGRAEKLHDASGWRGLHHRVRQKIGMHIESLAIDSNVAAILAALTIADKSTIDQRLWLLFQKFGINHLLVISGLHVGMVAAVGYLIGGIAIRACAAIGRAAIWFPGLCALLSATAFSALAGFSLPTQRALCLLACFVCAAMAGRQANAFRNLLLAALVVLLLNPLAGIGSGFWLSFGSVAGLLWVVRWQQGLGRVKRLLLTHGYMALLMLPLGALFFDGGSLVAMLSNMLMIPLVGWFVVPIALMAGIGSLCSWALAPDLWRLAGWPLAELLPKAQLLVDWGGTLFYQPLTAYWPAALLGVLGASLSVLPGIIRLRLLALVLLLPVLLPFRPTNMHATLLTEVTVLDVGQGTAVLIRSGEHALLYDTGGGDPEGVNMGNRVILPFLRRLGVSRLDTLIVSHPDLDHAAGAVTILDALEVARFRYGGAALGAHAGLRCRAGEAWQWPAGQVFQFLAPARHTHPKSNNNSCVLQIQIGNKRLLLPGDIEAAQERALVQYWGPQLRSDWLLAAHHGSRTSTSATMLKHILPSNVVISSGYANRFSHPHWRVMRRLQAQQAEIFNTASSGALSFVLAPGQPIRARVYRNAMRRYWM